MAARAPIAVVHLVRRANGPVPFETFLASYRRFPAEFDHELVLLFKGFETAAQRAPYLERAAAEHPASVEVPDDGFDLGAYLAAAATLENERLCLLNSFSEILAPGWLRLLERGLAGGSVGAAGATGSWASHSAYNLHQLGVHGAYSHAFESRRAARVAMHEISGTALPRVVPYWLYTARETARHVRDGRRFPNPHLRTNAFLIERERLLALGGGAVGTKWDAYRLESGRRSITARLCVDGTPPVVVDARGVARAPEDWHHGDVLFQGDQDDLLVADNQTRAYASATPSQRAVLSGFAWGDKARPHG